jgi:hypothetical protein
LGSGLCLRALRAPPSAFIPTIHGSGDPLDRRPDSLLGDARKSEEQNRVAAGKGLEDANGSLAETIDADAVPCEPALQERS